MTELGLLVAISAGIDNLSCFKTLNIPLFHDFLNSNCKISSTGNG